MQIAQISDGVIASVQNIQLKPVYDGGRWWDLRDSMVLYEWMQQFGWQEVVNVPRPSDTTSDWDKTVELVEGVPTEVWTPHAWTAEELTAREQADAQRARYETHEAILDATAALMTDAHTDGQPWVQPTGAHDSYPLGITATYGGKTWENLTPANVWMPGVSQLAGTGQRMLNGLAMSESLSISTRRSMLQRPRAWSIISSPSGESHNAREDSNANSTN